MKRFLLKGLCYASYLKKKKSPLVAHASDDVNDWQNN